jgi:hypothetical protein
LFSKFIILNLKESGTMKLKKWLSRALVLAMVVALMIPVPVAAKSSKSSGKLVKSVTYYSLSSNGSSWVLKSKRSYTYDKKNNPKEIKVTGYTNYMGVPVGASSDVYTLKYKYKGKNPKSMTMSEEGFTVSTAKYLKGKLASSNSLYRYSNDDGTYAEVSSNSSYFSYAKNGLPTAGATNSTYSETGEKDYNSTSNYTYVWDQKKGIPSLLLVTETEPAYPEYVSTTYVHFNKKGLATDKGWYDREKGTFDRPDYVYSYKMKKGVVTEAIVHKVLEDGTTKPVGLYKFKYTKTKISKSRYFNMINSFLGVDDCFNWF